MKKLLITLLSATALLTACNNNVGGKPIEHEIKPLTFNYPQDGYYYLDKEKDPTQGIWIKNGRIQALNLNPWIAYREWYSSNRVDVCFVATMIRDRDESHNVLFSATDCKSESDAKTITITPLIKGESKGKPMVFTYDHKVYPQ